MGWLNREIPAFLQWIGLFATIAGTGLALWAALSAKRAKEQATEAKEAAIRLGRILQLSDLINDLHELQTMIARTDFEAIAAKSAHLRGRVVRFKTEGYNELSDREAADLDLAREQLEIMTIAAVKTRAADRGRIGNIQRALAVANESLNRIFAIHHAKAHGE